MKELRLLRTPSPPQSSASMPPPEQDVQNSQRPISSGQTIEVDLTTRLDNVMRRCNNQEASKMVNDMMTGLFSKEHMASHTLTGTVSGEGTDPHAVAKHQLDRSAVQEIVARVLKAFPIKTSSEVRGMIRQKLSNAAKALKRKQQVEPEA
ncbi:BEN domain-containing protein 6-like isoform X2 [Apostichopus japonicus]|uniref:BEN domain-containing protein 6-like isoform X2 n=1 Tax=Stichopus japonicus TaxID=307972 RepID=UPI003AB84C98